MNRMRFGISFVAGLVALGLYSSALAHERHDDSNASGAVATITEEDIEYLPEEQIVHVSQPIRVENKDPFEHKSRVTLQHEGGGLGHIALKDHIEKSGTTFTFKLDKPGTYEIRCLLHDGMTATIKAVK